MGRSLKIRRSLLVALALVAVVMGQVSAPLQQALAAEVTYVGSNHSDPQAQRFKAATIPSQAQPGDTIVLVFTRASAVVWTGPLGRTGLTAVDSFDGGDLTSTVYRSTVATGDPGSSVRFETPGYAKGLLTLAVYRGVDHDAPFVTRSTSDTVAVTAHTMTTTSASTGATLLSYWVDRSGTTNGWSVPGPSTTRDTAIGTGAGRYGGVLADQALVKGGASETSVGVSTPATKALMWTIVLRSSGEDNPAPARQQWVLNQGLDEGSQSGWGPFSPATTLATTQRSNNWLLGVGNRANTSQDVGTCNSAPRWLDSTVAGTTYSATAQAMPSAAGTSVHLFLREVTAAGAQVRFVKSPSVTLTSTTSLTKLPTVKLTAMRAGNSIRMCVVATALPKAQMLYVDDFSLTSPGSPSASPQGPYFTFLFSRTEITGAINCVPNDTGVARLDDEIAPYLASKGMTASGTLVTSRIKETSRVCTHANASMMGSWADASMLSERYGWTFVSHTATYPLDISALSPERKYAETCGSAQAIDDHGLLGGHGLIAYAGAFAPPVDVQTQYSSTCFAWGRRYNPAATTQASAGTTPPYWQITAAPGGGACNLPSAPCYTNTSSKRYVLPSRSLANVKALTAGNWMTMQAFILVKGTSPAGSAIKWDCSAADPRLHWTNDNERYCWEDWKTVVDAVAARPDITVTDPLTVGIAFGRPARY